ncbi:MAG: hypothetical protein ACYC7A_20765 [Thermoanaerobaculia bacterium]
MTYSRYEAAETAFTQAVSKVVTPPQTGSISIYAVQQGWGLSHVKLQANHEVTAFGGSPPDGTLQEIEAIARVRCSSVAVQQGQRRAILSIAVRDITGRKIGELQMYLQLTK